MVNTCIAFALMFSSFGCNNPTAREPLPPPEPRPSSEYPLTEVVLHPDAPLDESRNTLYCGTFQLAWNKFVDQFGKNDQWTKSINPRLAQRLNNRFLNEKEVAADSIFTFAGILSPATKQEFIHQLHNQFPGANIPDLPWESNAMFSYALLEKTLHFGITFDRLPANSFPKGNTDRVNYFGIDPNARRSGWKRPGSNVMLLHYTGPDEFAVELENDNLADHLVLTRMPRQETLSQAIAYADKLASETESAKWIIIKRLAVPVFHFGIERSYEELFKNDSGNDLTVTEFRPIALQTIQFRLDEAGAILKSEATFAAAPAAAAERQEPKYVDLIFDQPFLLTLRYGSSKHPYFALWVENAEILERE